MEHNNIYIYHRGVGESILGKPCLFVFPYTETLAKRDIYDFIKSELGKKAEMNLPKVAFSCGHVCDQILKKDVVQHESKRAVILPYYYLRKGYTSCNIHPMNDRQFGENAVPLKNRNIMTKVDAMVKLYESIVNKQSVAEANSTLEANDIIYYDAQKLAGPKRFDKRSPEGQALISAKRIVQHEKLLAQRGYSINAKRRERNIGMSRLEVQDN